jgi:hypothetical protein
MAYKVLNNRVAVEPFRTDAVEKTGVKSGFVTVKQKTELTKLQVVFNSGDIKAGDWVYVRGDLCVDANARQIFEIDGKRFILIPLDEIKLVSYE